MQLLVPTRATASQACCNVVLGHEQAARTAAHFCIEPAWNLPEPCWSTHIMAYVVQEAAGGLPGHVLQQLSSVPVPDTMAPSIFDNIIAHNIDGERTRLTPAHLLAAECSPVCTAIAGPAGSQ